MSLKRLLVCLAALVLPSCSGDGAKFEDQDGAPVSNGNPCAAALALGGRVSAASAPAGAGVRERPDKYQGFGHDDRDPREFLALHQLARDSAIHASGERGRATRSGDLLVVNDDGSVILPANPLDVAGRGLRFQPNSQGGYDLVRANAAFRDALGSQLSLADDDTRERPLAFSFSFYGAARSAVFVNSDGNLTFGAGDTSLEARSLGRVLSGAPRVAAFFADLNPEAGGLVFVDSARDAFTVTWCGVPDYDETGFVTAQASLFPGGAVEIRIDEGSDLGDGVVALSPGATQTFAPLDLSAAGSGPTAGGAGALGERFAAQASLDLVSATRRALSELPDNYDQMLFWTDQRVTEPGTFAFETTIRNAITGIGSDVVDLGAAYGSPARLASLMLMDDLAKYSADPNARVTGENTTPALVAHETGHRWGATLRFRDSNGATSSAWLGRQLAHWSFFCDSDASVLEGNDIEDQGGGSFRTVETARRYGPFDLYAMGLLTEAQVPPTFYVTSPTGANFDPESAPRSGVSFSGSRRNVTIADVQAALGPRNPPAAQAPRVHRQAWVYVVGRGRTADAAALSKLDTIRRSFESFFSQATGGRMSVETRLD